MLKLIRLMPSRDLYTVVGFGVPEDRILVGSLLDSIMFLKQVGVPVREIKFALDYLNDRPDHNAVQFGVMNLGVICTSVFDTADILKTLGLTTEGFSEREGVRPCA